VKDIIFKQQTLFALLIILASLIGLIISIQEEPGLSPSTTRIFDSSKGMITLVLVTMLLISTMFLISILLKSMNNIK